MSGHSHWATIKHKKGAIDAKRGKLFSKLSRAIIIAARHGGGDPNMNLKLRYAIDKAREVSMPNDNIHRAIKRGIGDKLFGQPDQRKDAPDNRRSRAPAAGKCRHHEQWRQAVLHIKRQRQPGVVLVRRPRCVPTCSKTTSPVPPPRIELLTRPRTPIMSYSAGSIPTSCFISTRAKNQPTIAAPISPASVASNKAKPIQMLE